MNQTLNIIFCLYFLPFSNLGQTNKKICGVNFEAPKVIAKLQGIDSLKRIHANWIAFCPFALLEDKNPEIVYNSEQNWWGDTQKGLISSIQRAKKNGLQILIKPHFWVKGKNWAGEYLVYGKDQVEFEKNYTQYLLSLAKLCDSMHVDMLCIGTELKAYTQRYPTFFEQLIIQIRAVYFGKLIYAANWDEFEYISFWKHLDYIGIDAYFPLTNQKTPSKESLQKKWSEIIPKLQKISTQNGKKIILTEFGYRSLDFTAYHQWEFEKIGVNVNINFEAQNKAYEGVFDNIWNLDFIKGGFLWKWHNEDHIINPKNSDYSPQHKPVEKIIQKWYSQD